MGGKHILRRLGHASLGQGEQLLRIEVLLLPAPLRRGLRVGKHGGERDRARQPGMSERHSLRINLYRQWKIKKKCAKNKTKKSLILTLFQKGTKPHDNCVFKHMEKTNILMAVVVVLVMVL